MNQFVDTDDIAVEPNSEEKLNLKVSEWEEEYRRRKLKLRISEV